MYYDKWLSGLSAGEALYEAKKQFIAEYPNNNAWTAYTLTGNPSVYLEYEDQ